MTPTILILMLLSALWVGAALWHPAKDLAEHRWNGKGGNDRGE